LRNTAFKQRRILRLAHDNLGVWTFLGQDARDTLERAAGAISGDPVVKPLAGKIRYDFARGGP
jgi:hypothetical protein